MCTYIDVHVYVHVCMCMYTHNTCVCTHVHTHVYTLMYMYTHMYVYVYTHTCEDIRSEHSSYRDDEASCKSGDDSSVKEHEGGDPRSDSNSDADEKQDVVAEEIDEEDKKLDDRGDDLEDQNDDDYLDSIMGGIVGHNDAKAAQRVCESKEKGEAEQFLKEKEDVKKKSSSVLACVFGSESDSDSEFFREMHPENEVMDGEGEGNSASN